VCATGQLQRYAPQLYEFLKVFLVNQSRKVDRTITCPSCLAQNRGVESFCHQCGSPVGPMTNLDPIQTIQTEGFLLRKALAGRPRLIVVLGIWILHLPVLVVGIGVTIHLLLNLRGASDFVFILVMSGLSYYAFVVLYRITKNYSTIGKKKK
jgi:hypothetical protein